ncbi:uncharacterized protein LOC130507579 [Raphanus sativus]|uniref:Uncharacterized protein LOC108850105 n=1 Tax=Raphanus sativus TaxID=3726 RepID=A0A9W3D301_RAPSA|nr:uncharacterized protein LOC108850105 [Raphanus sativus]XP_056858260.1 uncharacterized protein LOC130507579 [Raphanus sativus]
MESKNPDDVVRKKLKHLLTRYDSHYLVSPTGHGAGGLGLFWKQELDLQILDSNSHVIDTLISFEGKSFFSSFVHASTDRNQRNLLWDSLLAKANGREDPWFVTGDFNDLICGEEKDGGPERPEGSFSDLRTFFSEADLFDLQHSGDFLSWRGQRGDHLVRCRLDRAVSNTQWAETFPTARCEYLGFESSDHMPIISFFDKGKRRRRGLFRYDRRLCKNEEAKKVISNSWSADNAQTVSEKLSSARSAISAWNKTQHRNSQRVIEQKKWELNKALSSPANDTALIQNISEALNAAYLAEEEYWRQRSRLLWLKLGDRNTGYFHATTKSRKRANGFSVLEKENGEMVYKEEEIISVIGNYFQTMFSSQPGDREEVVRQGLHPIVSDAENTSLTAIPTEKEIKEAAFSIHADKAPGPDGFSAGFFHTHWEEISQDIVREVQGFFAGESLPEGINDTHIRLIPKISLPQKVSDYRPIALCNVYYKIYSKILTRRLQPLMEKLISENQSAFVPGRAIGDNILITHEVLHYLKTSKAEQRCAMAVKTDMSKAYDRLEWEFISLVLLRLGFHRDVVRCIMQCITSVTYSFLINGLPRGMVVPSRGIRQGDPLSPYIFIMCSEVLSGLCNRAQEEGSLQGLRVARGSPRLTHLFFADDTMFFLQADKENCASLQTILRKYEQASGQSISKAKSAITFSRKTPASLKVMIKNELQIENEGGNGKYLGLPEHFGRRKRDLFSSVVDRIKQKARGRSNRYLSAAGKLVLLQSVLSAIPSYSMSSFMLPVSLCKRIQSAVTRYWWDNDENSRKMAWISWEHMAKPKAIGGLGFRDFQNFNISLLAKIGWRLLQNPNSLLARTLFGKYCSDSNVLSVSVTSSCSHGWRSILLGRDLLIKNLGWTIGNGTSVNVWSDPWLSLTSQLLPMGPPNESQKELTVSEFIDPVTRAWDIPKIRHVIPEYEDKIMCIYPSLTGAPDKLIWLGTKSGEYSTKSGYFFAVDDAENRELLQLQGPKWKSSVWNLSCAPKVKIFSWKALKGALPVGERLAQRQVPADPRCKRCGSSESIIHLLFQCRFAQQVWQLAPLATTLDVSGTLDLLASWDELCSINCLPPAGVTSSALVPWVCWNIWKARNKFVFEGHSASPEETLSTAIALAREWSLEVKKESAIGTKKTPQQVTAPPGTIVIRSDAAWSSVTRNAGLGWVVLTPDGSRSFSSPRHSVLSPLVAEGLALREAVRTSASLGLKKVSFESDSSQLVQAMRTESLSKELLILMADIFSFVSAFEFVCFSWIPRERNSIADSLAKDALIVSELQVVGDDFIAPN